MSVIVDIEKQLGSFRLNMKFEADNGILALLGASGCGKSMTLKCIAGIETPDRGHIEVDGRVLFDSEKRINLTPQQRRVGYLFQQYALFPNMTVEQNIACGVRNKALRKQRVTELIAAMQLQGNEKKKPARLSGGEQQRVALARILANEPEVLLLDEPFSALDSHLRFTLERQLEKTCREFGKTVILVSHDRDEVFRLSDSIAIVDNGSIDALGTRDEVFHNPVTLAGARLTGCKNLSRATPVDETHIFAEDWGISLETEPLPPGTNYVGIRLHDVRLGEGENSFPCEVEEVIENPFSMTVLLKPKGAPDGSAIGIDLSKNAWNDIKEKEEQQLCLPKAGLLLLKD